MNGRGTPQSRRPSAKGKSPAERAEEFAATQRQLKAEAAERREARGPEAGRRKRRG